ncbi:MAG: thiamine phosphate synthase [Actinomycetota bacterium]
MTIDPKRLAVYVVTSAEGVPGRTHLDVARAAVAGGATTVQVRAPGVDAAHRRDLAGEIAAVCRAAGTICVVNDDPVVARAAGADGVHVGQDDRPDAARAVLGDAGVVGVSVHTPDQARRAADAGADYLGVTVWETPTKPEARGIGLAGVEAIVAATHLPVVGIGGIHVANAASVIAAGAAGVAVVSAVGAADDPVEATRRLAEAIGAVVPR